MEWIFVIALAVVLAYLLYTELMDEPLKASSSSKRLTDYYAAGSTFEDIPSALKQGYRLLEVHVYSDERDQPVVAKQPLQGGYDYAEDNVSFEQVCVDIANDAFPSKYPMILSIVPHTPKSVTLNLVAEHIQMTLYKRLAERRGEALLQAPLDSLADKLIVVSGGNLVGTDLAELVHLNWDDSVLRRLGYNQAIHPRDQPELVAHNRSRITMVAPDPAFGKSPVNPETAIAYGCQWIFYPSSLAPGFTEKPASLQ